MHLVLDLCACRAAGCSRDHATCQKETEVTEVRYPLCVCPSAICHPLCPGQPQDAPPPTHQAAHMLDCSPLAPALLLAVLTLLLPLRVECVMRKLELLSTSGAK